MIVDPSVLDDLLEDATPEQRVQILNTLNTQLGATQGLGLAQQGFQNTVATATANLENERDNLFARANQSFRRAARNFAARGIGDSGFAQRERNEFGDQRERDERSLLIDFQDRVNRATQALNESQLAAQQQASNALLELSVIDPQGLFDTLTGLGMTAAEAQAYINGLDQGGVG